MNVYRITKRETEWNQNHSVVVVANTEKQAREIASTTGIEIDEKGKSFDWEGNQDFGDKNLSDCTKISLSEASVVLFANVGA